VLTACDCSCKGSESGKAEGITANGGGLSLRNGGDGPLLKLFHRRSTKLIWFRFSSPRLKYGSVFIARLKYG